MRQLRLSDGFVTVQYLHGYMVSTQEKIMNWLNIIVLAVFVLCVMNGIRRGFIRTVAAMFSILVSMVLVYFLNPYVVDFVKEKTPIYDTIEEKCSESIAAGLEGELGEQDQTAFIEELPLPESMKSILKESGESYGSSLADVFAGYLSSSIAHMIVNSLAFLVTFFVVSLILRFAVAALDSIFSLPVLSLLNRTAGAAAGCIQGLLIVWVFFLVITLFWSTDWGRTAVEMAKENHITKWLYDSNLLLKFVSGFLKI